MDEQSIKGSNDGERIDLCSSKEDQEVNSGEFVEPIIEATDQPHNDTNQEENLETNKKRKRLTSDAWQHFDITMINGEQRAKCKYCRSALSYTGSSGTSHLLKHANKTCSGRHFKLAAGQSQLKIKSELDGTSALAIKEKKWSLIKMFQGENW